MGREPGYIGGEHVVMLRGEGDTLVRVAEPSNLTSELRQRRVMKCIRVEEGHDGHRHGEQEGRGVEGTVRHECIWEDRNNGNDGTLEE